MGMSRPTAPTNSAEVVFEAFIGEVRRDLERMLVVRYGLEVGLEAASAAMAYAWREWSHVSTLEKPLAYLYRVGQSEARRHHRWRRTIALPPENSPPSDSTNRLHEALAQLGPDQRTAVVLVHGYGYRYEEAAEMLGIPLSTIRNHLHRGRSRLKKLLEEVDD